MPESHDEAEVWQAWWRGFKEFSKFCVKQIIIRNPELKVAIKSKVKDFQKVIKQKMSGCLGQFGEVIAEEFERRQEQFLEGLEREILGEAAASA